MPEVAFIVKVNLDMLSPEELTMTSEEIHDACSAQGIDVTSVVPWQHPSLNTTVIPGQPNLPGFGQ